MLHFVLETALKNNDNNEPDPMQTSTSPARLRHLIVCLSLLLIACDDDERRQRAAAATGPDYWPTEDWQTAAPETSGFSAGALDTLAADAESVFPRLTSLLVIKDGYIVHESYHSPGDTEITADSKHQLWSVTKSVTSMTLGAAWRNGDLLPGDLDSTVDDNFSALLGDIPVDAERRDISLRHALYMQSGIRWNELWDASITENPLFAPDPSCTADATVTLCSLLRRAQSYAPGAVWNYSTYDSYLVAAFFLALTDNSVHDYAAANLFAPLGIDYVDGDWLSWPTDSEYTYGGALLALKSRDMAKLGLLMLYDGRWEDEQLLAPDWLTLSTTPIGTGLVATFDGNNEPAAPVNSPLAYSMQWWNAEDFAREPDGTLNAHGLFGQMIHIDPGHGLVVVITHDTEGAISPFENLHAFIADEITAGL